MTEQELIELLADKEHASWARWMAYLFSKCERRADGSLVIPANFVEHWQREIDTPYAALPERYQQSDRDEVAHILPIIRRYVAEEHPNARHHPPADTAAHHSNVRSDHRSSERGRRARALGRVRT